MATNDRLMKHIPNVLKNVSEVVAVESAIEPELVLAEERIKDVFDQFFVDTATWGLRYFENVFGIETDISRSYELRREHIKAKMRSAGTTTKEMIKNMAEAFSNGEVEVIEDAENSNIHIKFVGVLGVPANMIDLISNVKEIIPAHLMFEFEYTYHVWDDFKETTWDDLFGITWEEMETVSI